MKRARPNHGIIATLASLSLASVLPNGLRAAETEDTNPAVPQVEQSAAAGDTGVVPTEPNFVVPDGSAAEKIKFIEKLAQPTTSFASTAEANKYWSLAAVAMKSGAEQILAEESTESEAAQAIQFKAESLRILAMIGDKNADQERIKFLDATLKDPRVEVSGIVGQLRMNDALRRWMTMNPDDRAAAIRQYVTDVEAVGPTAGQAKFLVGFANSMGDSTEEPDVALAAGAVRQLLPKFQATFRDTKEPATADLLATLEGLDRRFDLPGKQLELEGTLFDGKPLEWKSYHGKVVLVDFWASWCPDCLKEIPNVRQAYQTYHDRGFEVLGICLDNDRRLAEETIRQHEIPWPHLFAEQPPSNGWLHPMQLKYAVIGIPRAILVDAKGNVVSVSARGRTLTAELHKLLGPVESSATRSAAAASSGAAGR